MADPVVEQIAKAILTALGEIVTDGNAADVQRPLRTGIPDNLQNKSLVLFQGDPTRDQNGPHGFAQWMHEFEVCCFVRPSDNSATAVDETINILRADVETKLREDPTWGSLALDTRIGDPFSFTTGDGTEGVFVVFSVIYRTLEDDPYSQS